MSARATEALYYDSILELSSRYATIWLCQEFGVSRSGYYKWIRRKDKPNYSQYCSLAFTTLLKRNGIIQSMS